MTENTTPTDEEILDIEEKALLKYSDEGIPKPDVAVPEVEIQLPEEQPKKKRGRPKKEHTKTEEKIPKKRGRPKKVKKAESDLIGPDSDVVEIKRKRGRPKKEKTDDDIHDAIREINERFGVTLSEDQPEEALKTIKALKDTIPVSESEDDIDTLEIEDEEEEPIIEPEIIHAGVSGPLPDHSTLQGTLAVIEVGDETEIKDGVDIEQPVPIVEDAQEFLHLVPYKNADDEKWWRYVISPFDEEETARWLKHRDVVTKFGFDTAPCDYWDQEYLTSIYYDEAGAEIGVFHIINSSAMKELGMFMPAVRNELRDEEIAKLLDAETKSELIRVSAENKTLRQKVRWWEEYTKKLIAAKDETGGKLFAHMADMASILPETDRWEQPGQKKGIFKKIIEWFEKHETVKMILTIVIIFGSLFLLLLATGIIRIR